MQKSRFILFFAFLFAIASPAAMAMSSTNYMIQWDNLNQGGDELGSSENYKIHDTIGGAAVGTSSSTNYNLSAGYRTVEGANTLGLTVRGQANVTEVAYSAFDNGANTVTVSSAAGYVSGDYVAVVENHGFSQYVAVGRITNIAGTVITVDDFDGDGGSMSASPAGANDFVYNLSSNAASFGTVAAGTEYTSTAMTSVLSSVSSGYSVYIQANQNLQNATADLMTNVSDGAVSSGSEEYGAEVTGATAFGAGSDRAVTTTQRVIQTAAATTGSVPDKVAMIYKLSITSATVAGTYTQNVYYTLTPNF